MSLIDPKHLLGPFRNTVHLVSIVFIVMLFAVYRLATGGVEVADRTLAPAPRGTAEAPAPAAPVAANPLPANAVGNIENMLGARPKPDRGAPPAGNKSLDDIEQALGLGR